MKYCLQPACQINVAVWVSISTLSHHLLLWRTILLRWVEGRLAVNLFRSGRLSPVCRDCCFSYSSFFEAAPPSHAVWSHSCLLLCAPAGGFVSKPWWVALGHFGSDNGTCFCLHFHLFWFIWKHCPVHPSVGSGSHREQEAVWGSLLWLRKRMKMMRSRDRAGQCLGASQGVSRSAGDDFGVIPSGERLQTDRNRKVI